MKKSELYFAWTKQGLLAEKAREYTRIVYEDWIRQGLYSVFEGRRVKWFTCSNPVRRHVSELLGAKYEEIAVPGQHGMNQHIILTKMYCPTKERYKIVTNKPLAKTLDIFALQSNIEYKGYDPREVLLVVGQDELQEAILKNKDSICLVFLTAMDMRTCEVLDMKGITKFAKDLNLLIGWDLSQVCGTMPLQISDWGVDFAVVCGDQYLCGGPYSYGIVYLNQRNFNYSHYQLTGWFGNDPTTQFVMKEEYQAAQDATRLHTSGQSPVQNAFLEAGSEQILAFGLQKMRDETLKLLKILDEGLSKLPQIMRVTGSQVERRGSGVSLKLKKECREELKRKGIRFDEQKDDICLFSINPIYQNEASVMHLLKELATLDMKE